MRTIKIYEPCEQCKGSGLEFEDKFVVGDCPRCQGHGENRVNTMKEADYERELSARDIQPPR